MQVHCVPPEPLLPSRVVPPMNSADIKQLIEAGFDDALVNVESDDNTHFSALVVAKEFEHLRALARHQLVYQCLGTLMGDEIHALSISALTPAEWREQGGAPASEGHLAVPRR